MFTVIFLIGVLLLRIPSFYILPIKNIVSTSHSIVSLIILLLFIDCVIRNLASLLRIIREQRSLFRLVLIYLLMMSLSVVTAINLNEFIKVYKNIIISIIIFILVLNFVKKNQLNKILLLLVLSICINLFYQTIIYYRIDFLHEFLSNIIYDKYWVFVQNQANRGRFFIEIYDWVFIPILFYLGRKDNRIFYVILVAIILFYSNLSNYRSILIVTMLSLLASLIINFDFQKSKIKIFLGVLMVVVILITSNSLSLNLFKQSSISRFALSEEDTSTVDSRLFYWDRAINMGLGSPLFGVGLGNYYEYLSPKQILKNSVFDWKNEIMRVTAINPHNIFFSLFAETGLLGLASFIMIAIYLVSTDLHFLKYKAKKDIATKSLMISFWSLFLLSLFNPTFDLQYQSLFWLLRGLILQRFSKTF